MIRRFVFVASLVPFFGVVAPACGSSSSGNDATTPPTSTGGASGAAGSGGETSGSGGASGATSSGGTSNGGSSNGGSSGSGGASAGSTGSAGYTFMSPSYDPGPRPASVTFPSTFLFAAASAGMQAEKGLVAADWHAWADLPNTIQNGDKPDDGPDFFGHEAGDIQAMLDAGLGAYRFSIELERLYPTKAAFDADMPDPDGLAKYDGLFEALKTAGITPVVTLQHFAFPNWLSDVSQPMQPQGWERDATVAAYVEFAKRAATRWGKYVDWWVTINEPNVMASVGYVLAFWPPGVSDLERMATVERNQVIAHAKMYDAIHAADTIDADGDGKSALVSMAFHNRVYAPRDPSNPDDVAAANHSTYVWNFWYLRALTKGDFDWDFDESLDGPNDKKADPDLANRLDYIGLNYYGLSQVTGDGVTFPYLGAAPSQQNLATPNPKTAMGWDIYPQGFGQVIDQLKEFSLPIFITENGVAQEQDEPTRPRFVMEHLFEVGWAMQRGADIRGYTYWALTDNFEWKSGFCPKFGLYHVDYTDPTRPRAPANGRDTLKSIATSRSIAQTDIDALAPYPAKPAKACAAF